MLTPRTAIPLLALACFGFLVAGSGLGQDRPNMRAHSRQRQRAAANTNNEIDSAAIKGFIAADYAKMDAALSKKELKGAVEFYARDFEMTSTNGFKGSLKDLKQQLRRDIAGAKSVQSKTTIKNFALKGNTATLNASWQLENITRSRPIPTVELEENREDQWVVAKGAWTLKSSKVHEGPAPR